LEITTRYGKTDDEPFSERTPVFRNFSYSNITIVNAKQIASIEGLPEKAIEQLRFTDITATGEAGFIVDNATDVEMHNVRLTATKGPALSVVAGNNLVLDDVSPRAAGGKAPGIALTDCADVYLRNSRAAAGTGTFLQLAGAKTTGILLTQNEFSRAAKDIESASEVGAPAVLRR
jgi:hypothetical protein